MTARSSWLRAMVGTTAFGGAAFVLLRLGSLDWMFVDWSDPLRWLAETEIEVALAALSRVGGLALLGWIGISTILYALGRLAGVRSRSIDWLSVGPFRRTVDALLAGYLMLGAIAPAGAAAQPSSDPPPVSHTRPVPAPVDPRYVPVPAGPPAETAPTPDPGQSADEGTDAEETEEAEEGRSGGRVVVAPGDNVWDLAGQRLAQVLARSPTTAEIAPYWRRMVEANRDVFRSGHPDLIFPGEELVLPPVRNLDD